MSVSCTHTCIYMYACDMLCVCVPAYFVTDALFELLMKMVIEPVPADNELATGIIYI